MLNNFTISQFSLQFLFVSPIVAQTFLYEKTHFNSFFRINCMKSIFSFLYSKSNANIIFKQSTFAKFNGQSPIFMNSRLQNFKKSSKFYNFSKISINDEEKNYYEGEAVSTTLLFYADTESSVTFKQCSFIDCINDYNQGGAISFRRSQSSLIIEECTFLRCKSYQSAGAIFVLQLMDGNWLVGDFTVTSCKFEECNDCNGDNGHEYVAGVIEGSIAKGNRNYCFSFQRSELLNCEFDKKNRITEAQIRVSANIFQINYCNITNSNQKVDLSAIFFNKYVQEPSSIIFLNAINQHGFSFFEIYNLESSFIDVKNVNMINTTFVNYDKDELLTKIAFFNIYFEHEKSLYVDNFFIVDFETIADEENQNYKTIYPVIIKIPETSKEPITSNIFSNKMFDQTNLVNYIYIPTMSYDYQKQIIIGISSDNETITEEPIIPTEITAITHSNQYNFIINSIHDSTEKKKLTFDAFWVVLIILTVVIINVLAIVIVKIRKSHSFLIDDADDDDGEFEIDDENNGFDEKIQRDENVVNHSIKDTTYDLFFNPNCRQKLIDLSKQKMNFISSMFLENEDIFKDDFEEMKEKVNDKNS